MKFKTEILFNHVPDLNLLATFLSSLLLRTRGLRRSVIPHSSRVANQHFHPFSGIISSVDEVMKKKNRKKDPQLALEPSDDAHSSEESGEKS